MNRCILEKAWIPALIFFVFWISSSAGMAAATVSYTYDDAGRLTAAEYDNQKEYNNLKKIDYTYDAMGNLRSRRVNLTAAQTPALNVNPAGLDFGADKVTLPLTISNQGTDTLNWAADSQQNWISLDPASGTTTTENAQLVVAVSRGGLAPGTYTGAVSVTSNGGNQEIGVSMKVDPLTVPIISASRDDLSPSSGRAALTPLLEITNYEDLNFSPAEANWIIYADTGGGEDEALFDSGWTQRQLASFRLPDGLLDPNNDYWAKVVLQDAFEVSSQSGPYSFTTILQEESEDADGNGVPDDQQLSEAEAQDYFNEHPEAGAALREQGSGTSKTVGIEIDRGTVAYIASHRPDDFPAKPEDGDFPYGLFSLKITDLAPGETVRITFIFPEAVAGPWYRYNEASGWSDYSEHVIEYKDNRATIEIKDGGFGDADGVANGSILDPSGPAHLEKDKDDDDDNNCFISSLAR